MTKNEEKTNQFISIIIPTFNRLNYLEKTLQKVFDLAYDNYEIIVVNDGSDDGTYDYLKKLNNSRLRIFNQKNQGRSNARNLGIKNARSEIVALLDDDCCPAENWLNQINKTFSDKSCNGVIGKTVYVSDDHKPCFPEKVVQNPKAKMPMSGNIAYKKNIIELVGYFDPYFNDKRYEDKDLALKVIRFGQLESNPEMKVYHQLEFWKPKQLLEHAKNAATWVDLIKKHGNKIYCDKNNPPPIFANFVLYPKEWLCLIFLPILLPILLFRFIFIKKQSNLKMFFLRWIPYIFLRRWYIWQRAWQLKIFVI